MLEEILQYNKTFVEKKEYEKYQTSKYPDKKVAIVSCMDARLTELLPAALGIKNGDAKIIKNAGGTVSEPFGTVMRSLLVAIYELGVEEILVIGHTDCGVQGMNSEELLQKMKECGITQDSIDFLSYCDISLESWLCGFHKVETAVQDSVQLIRKHPFIPDAVKTYGLIIDTVTGELTKVADLQGESRK